MKIKLYIHQQNGWVCDELACRDKLCQIFISAASRCHTAVICFRGNYRTAHFILSNNLFGAPNLRGKVTTSSYDFPLHLKNPRTDCFSPLQRSLAAQNQHQDKQSRGENRHFVQNKRLHYLRVFRYSEIKSQRKRIRRRRRRGKSRSFLAFWC